MFQALASIAAGTALIAFAPSLAGAAIGMTHVSLQRYSEPVIYGVIRGAYRWCFTLLGGLLLIFGALTLWRSW